MQIGEHVALNAFFQFIETLSLNIRPLDKRIKSWIRVQKIEKNDPWHQIILLSFVFVDSLSPDLPPKRKQKNAKIFQ